ncbi:thiol-disulfide oxidoreductase [Pandoraea cepalis]|uniref:Thiol-disulfide oxidoreductase n=2 Tax=Pandoraea TaxID=93217 RepID=A0AAW7MJV8_9BURK|nr:MULTISPECIES: TlpA disulfide reductase family protein [Pandoraea]MDN4573042.1 thiol-disulfide oxidoreductase [Pandoraea cepalis]MDN4577847.1 thiol-disulfide oxidoreductase [Pandoraea cepalis]VVE34391.1 Thiol-disulfide oxidoreductase ResA [Pandoraea soli]
MHRRHFLHTLGALGTAGALGGVGAPARAAGPVNGAAEVDDSALAGTSGGTLSAWRGATPAFTLDGLDGRPHALSEWRGRVVILNFWATWCGPCREEIPAMGEVARRYRQRGLALVAVNYKEPLATVKPFVDKLPIDGTVLLDADGAVYKRFGSLGLPATYLVDRAGNARFWRMGELEWSDVGLHGHIEALLTQKGGTTA